MLVIMREWDSMSVDVTPPTVRTGLELQGFAPSFCGEDGSAWIFGMLR